MTKYFLLFTWVLAISGCQTGTTVLIEKPMSDVAAQLRHHYDDKMNQTIRRMSEITTSTSITLKVNEDFDKLWSTDTRITIVGGTNQFTRITILTERTEPSWFLLWNQTTRQQLTEGHRMAEILKLLDIQPPRSSWSERRLVP